MGLWERNAENCIQSVVSALHPNKIPDQTDEEIQGKVITLHSTSFYDGKTAPIGKAFHEGCHLCNFHLSFVDQVSFEPQLVPILI